MNAVIRCVLVVLLGAVIQSRGVAALPSRVESSIQRIEGFYRDGVPTKARVELMIVAPDVHLDPPPTAANFALKANVTIGVDALTASDYSKDVVGRMKSSAWQTIAVPGYPRWYWRVVDGSGDIVADLLIDEERSIVSIGGAWYGVDRALIKRLTTGFVDLATKEVLNPSGDQKR